MALAKRFVCLGACAVALVLPSGAGAAIAVTNQNDSGPGSLRQAVADAPPGETITVPNGDYTLSSGEILIEKSLTIAGQSRDGTVLRAGPAARLFRIEGAGNAVTIGDLTLRGGRPSASSIERGGAVYVTGEASLALHRVLATDNVVDVSGEPGVNGGIGEGGAIAALIADLAIFDSVLTGNTVDASGGSEKNGGIGEGGAVSVLAGALTIERSHLSGNQVLVPGGQGPAAPGQNGGIADGGAVFVISSEKGRKVVATTISGNRLDASGGPGSSGGIAQGGGLFAIGEGPLQVTEVTVAGNSTSIAGPSAGIAQGGGIYAAGGGKLAVLSSTIVGNSAAAGEGGNVFASTASFTNSIVSGGAGGLGKENCSMPFESGGFNIDGGDGCGFGAAGDRINTDPVLGPLQDNGGPVPTMVPQFGGPAVDQGAAFGLTTDARGLPRPIDFPALANPALPGADGSDIGAAELQASTAFTFGRLSRNRKRGTARITINLPSPTFGALTLFGKGLKKRTVSVQTHGTVTLPVVTKGRVAKKLRKRGRRKVGIKVQYAAAGNAPVIATRTVTLVKKKPKRHKKHRKHRRHQAG